MGVLPDQEGISWESHLLGSLVGIFVAYLFKAELEEEEAEAGASRYADGGNEVKQPFLLADVFEKTKAQRAREAEEEERRRREASTYFPPFWNQDKTW